MTGKPESKNLLVMMTFVILTQIGWVNRPDERICRNPLIRKLYTRSILQDLEALENIFYQKERNYKINGHGGFICIWSEVDDADCWPSILELSNKNKEVLNAGVAGYGLDRFFAF